MNASRATAVVLCLVGLAAGSYPPEVMRGNGEARVVDAPAEEPDLSSLTKIALEDNQVDFDSTTFSTPRPAPPIEALEPAGD